jgi:hypothetical protein
MTITSIGSSFSYIRPDSAARETAPAAANEEAGERASRASDDGAEAASGTSATTREKKPVSAVSDELNAALLRVQENRAAEHARTAAKAYGHG